MAMGMMMLSPMLVSPAVQADAVRHGGWLEPHSGLPGQQLRAGLGGGWEGRPTPWLSPFTRGGNEQGPPALEEEAKPKPIKGASNEPETFVDVFREALWLVTIMVCAVILPSLMVGGWWSPSSRPPPPSTNRPCFLPVWWSPCWPWGGGSLGPAESDGLLPADGEPDPRGGG